MDASRSTSASGRLWQRTTARIASAFLDRRCINTQSQNTCEKPAASTNAIIGVLIGVGVVLFLVVMSVLLFLHLRRTKQDKAELANDPHELSDYGIDELPVGKKGDHKELPRSQHKRISSLDLLDAQDPFGTGAELADSDKVSASAGRKASPPRYPETAVKM